MKTSNKFKSLLLISAFFCHSSSFATSTPNFEKELFEVNRHYDIKGSAPSFKSLHKDAEARKSNLTHFFNMIRAKGLKNGHVRTLFKKDVESSNNLRSTKLVQMAKAVGKNPLSLTLEIPEPLVILRRLKCDYALDFDLINYFSICLERFSKTPPTSEQINMLYDQAVHVVRTSLESLWSVVFDHMLVALPQHFIAVGEQRRALNPDQIAFKLKTEEERLYYSFILKFSGSSISDKDTIEITEMALDLLEAPAVQNPSVIYELNNILFYLNIERALLTHAPDLQYDKTRYNLDSHISQSSQIFFLSHLVSTFRTGFIASLGSEHAFSQSTLATYTRKANDYLTPSLNFHDTKGLEIYLNRMFQDAPQESASPKKSNTAAPSKTQSTSHGKKSQKKNAENANAPKKASIAAAPSATPAASASSDASKTINTTKDATKPTKALAQQDQNIDDQVSSGSSSGHSSGTSSPIKLDYLSALMANLQFDEASTPVFAEELDAHSFEFSASHKSAMPNFIHSDYAPYVPTVSFDTYAYKRCITGRPYNTYQFEGELYSFSGFDVFAPALLEDIHSSTHQIGLPNLATYSIHFHVKIGDADVYTTQAFNAPHIYLSGTRYFADADLELKNKNRLMNAYHDILTPAQQRQCYTLNPEERKNFIRDLLHKKLEESVVKGPWKSNASDSEALLFLDLQHQLPQYLYQMTHGGTKAIEIGGIALGLNSYRDVCWRCRNLVQGWQWGLEDSIMHWAKEMKITDLITLSPNFGTAALTFGEIAAGRNHNSFIRYDRSIVVLGKGARERDQHQFTATQLPQ
ncbi:MAG: hypothetical protein ACTHJ4_08795 [Candidatus Nucleicultricaceae bacterium]